MNIKLEPRYRNYWLDLARKEEEEKESAKKEEAMSKILQAISSKKIKP